MSNLRATIVGCGLIGSLHAQILHERSGVELVAIADQDEQTAQSLGQKLGVPSYTDFASLLANHQVDLVVVATPEQHRLEPTRLAMEHGAALLLEKPLGTDLAAADEVISLLNGYEHPVGVNFILHADGRYATMRDQVRAGAVGQVASTFARRRGTKLGIEKYAPWTDLLLSTAIHDLEMMLAINPSPLVRVYAEGVQRLCAPYGNEDAVVATLKFADGAIASLDTSWTLPGTQPEPLDPAFHVVGDQGGIFIDGSSHGMRVISEDAYRHPDMTHWPMLPYGMGGALTNAVRLFVEAVQNGSAATPLTTLAQARRAHMVVDALKESLAQERPVTVEDTGPTQAGAGA